jgi:integrase/recombinase XerD
MPNITKRGKFYWGRIQIEGKSHRKSLRTRHAAEAQARYKKWEQQLKAEIYDGKVVVLWEEAANEFITLAKNLVPTASTRDRYFVSIRRVSEHLEGTPLSEIDLTHIGRVIQKRRLDEVTNATLRRDLTAMSWVFRVAIKEKWCQHNPALEYDRDFIPEHRDPIAIPSDTAVEDAASSLPGMMADAVRFARLVGLRQEEIFSLQWSAIGCAVDENGTALDGTNGRERILQITLLVTKTKKKRVIRLTGPLLADAAIFLDQLPRHITKPFVFWHSDGERYKNFSSNFLQQRKTHGIGFRFHDLRHKFAVDYLRRGGHIYDLQLILGHSSIRTTEIYLEELDQVEQKIAKHGRNSMGA